MRILDHLEPLPAGGLDAFITRLEDGEDQVRRNLRSYVVTDAVKERLDVTLREGLAHGLHIDHGAGCFRPGEGARGRVLRGRAGTGEEEQEQRSGHALLLLRL